MAKYTLRAVSRNPDGTVTDIADSWPLNSRSLEEARAEADRQKWGERSDVANAFEIVDEAGRMLTWRAFHEDGEEASWT